MGAGELGGGRLVASDSGGNLYFVEADTGTASSLGQIKVGATDPGPAGPVMTDVAFDTSSGLVYGISFSHLYILNLSDPQKSRCVGAMGAGSLNGLVVAPDGRLFAAGGSGDFYEIDPVTARTKRIGSFGGGLAPLSAVDLGVRTAQSVVVLREPRRCHQQR